ncbi:hypothetical protein SAMN05443144_113133 [Fodinibius roseus]|uniref:Uncharacterized protein n=1 Tax=Fodinibius roseus TaxID=1194090 RepID=A0A1M5ER41_9BACT|nr:hypothetical protein [Fodinibius roseus]SHF81482.1 hypothetical protein SAMN05443144_113133 [Fodinibius roseus]
MEYRLCKSFIFLLFLIIVGCLGSDDLQTSKWQLVYQNDFNGNRLSGSIRDLVNAMKKGSPVRVSWGGTEEDGSSWIEFAEPVFTTVMNDTVVVVQFPLSFIQTHYTDPDKAFLQTDPPTGWRAIMSTTGSYHQFHYDFASRRIKREIYSRTNMSWFALTSSKDIHSVPDLAPENAFKLDSTVTK